jgi:WD40 repeat protein
MSGRNRASRRRKQIEVYNVAWTSDDRWVLTLQSFPRLHEPGHSSSRDVDARLKVWDSFSGVLQHTIEVAHGRCVVLAPHPNNPSIVVTGGEDGVISLWNVFKEECLLKHSMFHTGPERFGYVEGDPIAAVDGAFSPDGR